MICRVLVHNPFIWYQPMSYISWAIRKATGRYYNHAALMVYIYGAPYIIQAVFPRVTLTPYFKWQSEKKRDIKYEEVECKEEYVIKTALNQVGKPYDLKGLLIDLPLYLLWHRWTGHTGQWAIEKFYCYELVNYCLSEPDSFKSLPKE